MYDFNYKFGMYSLTSVGRKINNKAVECYCRGIEDTVIICHIVNFYINLCYNVVNYTISYTLLVLRISLALRWIVIFVYKLPPWICLIEYRVYS